MKAPGATTSGLKRPNSPSTPIPTLPLLENEATWSRLSVNPRNIAFVNTLPSTSLVTNTAFVIFRKCSKAPTVMTFLAFAGDGMLLASPPSPKSVPSPELPAANT